MESFEQLLLEAMTAHGHLCPGQVLGVRMAMVGCREVGIDRPKESRSLMVWVEIDRCATDAIQSVTGCQLGKRTLKYVDYGKMAATFLDTETGRAVRVVARDDSREKALSCAPVGSQKKEVQLQAYKVMPEELLFVIQPVSIGLSQNDRPGHPLSRILCHRCGEGVNDGREVRLGGMSLCRACATGAYYSEPRQDLALRKLPSPPLGTVCQDAVALVLAGGESRRMGMPKPFVLWHGVPLIVCVVEALKPIFGKVYTVAREQQPFGELGLPVITDLMPGRGPLVGLYSGLVSSGAEWAFVVGCDFPLLSPEVIAYMGSLRSNSDVVAARVNGTLQPLHAFYSKRCIPAAERLLAKGIVSVQELIVESRATMVPEGELRCIDPALLSFNDVDSPDELRELEMETP